MTEDQSQYTHIHWALEVRNFKCNGNISNCTINQLTVIFRMRATRDCYKFTVVDEPFFTIQ